MKTSRKSAARGSFMYAFRLKIMLFNTDGVFLCLKVRKPLSILKRKNQNNNIFQALSTPLKHYCTPLKNCFSVCTSDDRRLLTSVIVCNVDQCGWTDTIMNTQEVGKQKALPKGEGPQVSSQICVGMAYGLQGNVLDWPQ